jgi:hypothetical protein
MKTILFLVLVTLAVCAWAPWMSPESTKLAIENQFSSEYRSTNPLFTGSCTLLAMGDITKEAFAYKTTVDYICDVSGEGTTSITHTFYGSVIGAPSK